MKKQVPSGTYDHFSLEQEKPGLKLVWVSPKRVQCVATATTHLDKPNAWMSTRQLSLEKG